MISKMPPISTLSGVDCSSSPIGYFVSNRCGGPVSVDGCSRNRIMAVLLVLMTNAVAVGCVFTAFAHVPDNVDIIFCSQTESDAAAVDRCDNVFNGRH